MFSKFGKKKPAHIIWLGGLAVSPQLRMDLERFVANPHFLATNLRSHFASHGPDVVFPLLTVAPFVDSDVRDLVIAVIREVGDSSVPTLLAILDKPLFEDYRRVLRQSGFAETGAMFNALLHSRQVYGNALDSLADLVAMARGVRPWFSAARAVALLYRDSGEIVFGGAIAVVAWIDHEVMIASGTITVAGLLGERESSRKFSGQRMGDTGWGRSELEYQRQLRAREQQHEEEARTQAAAAFFWIEHQRKKKH